MNVVYDDDVGENLSLLVVNGGKSPRHQFRVKTIRFTGRPGNKIWYDDHLGVCIEGDDHLAIVGLSSLESPLHGDRDEV